MHELISGQIFVFGSNLQGIHGAGAALYALKHCGALWGVGEGIQGQSYAIPTCSAPGIPLLLDEVNQHVKTFIKYALDHPQEEFFVTAIGTGYAGFKHKQIAPMFADAPSNCILPPEWKGIKS